MSATGTAHSPAPGAPAAARKATLRQHYEAVLRAVEPPERARAGQRASDLLVALLAAHVPPGAPVALFAPTPLELPVDAAIAALAGRHPLAFPIVRDGSLAFLEAPFAALAARANKVREPPPDARAVVPRAVVVPGRAFDARGVRLGRGRGYYDRALAGLPPDTLTIGFCFERQVADRIPDEAHDQRLAWLVTEQAARATAPDPHDPPGNRRPGGTTGA